MIDYLVPQFFLNFDAKVQAGVKNPSGGMRTKIRSVQKAMTNLQLYTHTRVETLKSDFVLVEPLFFRENLPEQPDYGPLGSLKRLDDYDGVKILYCSEKELLRWTGNFREKILDTFDVVTYNCEYQGRLWEAIGLKGARLLTDPIDCGLFKPLPKKFQVVSTGWISSDKNSEFIRDLYDALHQTKIDTVYVGGNTLWGFNRKANMQLEHDIRGLTDVFVENAPQDVLAKYIGESAFFCGNTIHDTFSGCHAESVAAGCITVAGGHPLYSERFGFYVEPGVDAAMQKLSELTNGFSDMPDADYFVKARQWAEDNVGFDAFNRQLGKILSSSVTVNHGYVKEVDDDESKRGVHVEGKERFSRDDGDRSEEGGTASALPKRESDESVRGSTGRRRSGRNARGVQRAKDFEAKGVERFGEIEAVVSDVVKKSEGGDNERPENSDRE